MTEEFIPETTTTTSTALTVFDAIVDVMKKKKDFKDKS